MFSPFWASSPDSRRVFLVELSDLSGGGLGVVDRLKGSESSRTNSGSKSEGSGPFSETSPVCLFGTFCRDGRLAGDSAREEGFLGALDGGGDVRVERCLACSSAILESIAPLRRYSGISTALLGIRERLT